MTNKRTVGKIYWWVEDLLMDIGYIEEFRVY
jgi:hypothetical protein